MKLYFLEQILGLQFQIQHEFGISKDESKRNTD